MIAIGLGALLATALLELAVLSVARRRGLLVAPNARSSHRRPTPGIGGVAFVIVVVGFCFWRALEGDTVAGVAGAGGLVLAIVGLIDDLEPLSSRLRLVAQALVIAAAFWWLGLPATLGGGDPRLETILAAILAAGALWFVNLFNFMDGTDGLAASQCLFLVAGLLLAAPEGASAPLLWVLGGAMVAFLGFNWAPARIFMGDVGSAFLGFVLVVLVLAAQRDGTLPLVGSLILLAVFWFDATYTLCVRIATRQRFTSAHRSHLYQKMASRWGHGVTAAAFWAYALGWLAPAAWLATRGTLAPWGGVLAAVTPLVVLAMALRAGLPETVRE